MVWLMDDRLISQIEDLGLSNKEARVYVANLMLGPSGVQQIAELSGIKRVTTYVILESLVSMGLVSQTIKARKTLFNAESPENLKRLLDSREKSLKEQRQQLLEIMPDLNALKNLPTDAPMVKFYEGIEAIRSINTTFFEQFKREGVKKTYGISDLDQLRHIFPDIEERAGNPERIKARINSKFIYTSSRGPVMAGNDIEAGRESKYIPRDLYSFNCDISIAGDYVLLVSLTTKNPIGVVIKSVAIADGMKMVFDLAWKAASKYPQ